MTDYSAGAIAPERSDELTASFSADRANRVARNAVTSMNVHAAARDVSHMRTYHDTFCVSRVRTGKVTNQRHSGRCWMFAAFNVARAATMQLLDVDDFEFSQAYGFFYDKLEKFNVGLEYVIETAALPLDSREVSGLLDHCMGDGNYYPAAMNIIKKWGLVPKDAMPESACTKDADQMNAQLERLFRKSAMELRRMAAAGAGVDELRAAKEGMVAQCHRVLCVCLGEPPTTIDVEIPVGEKCRLRSSRLVEQHGGERPDGKPRRLLVDRGITPREFAERYVPFDPDDYVQLVHMPGETRPFGRVYHRRFSDTMAGGRPLKMLNVEFEVLEDAAVASLRAGVPCEMACDVAQQFPRRIEDFPGVLACDTMDYEGLFGVDLSMDRAEMIDAHETRNTHAMTFQGVELGADGRPVAWRIENSWGEDACKDGYLVASADWYRTYGGEVVVRREFVPEDVLDLWDNAPVEEVDPWTVAGCAMAPRV